MNPIRALSAAFALAVSSTSTLAAHAQVAPKARVSGPHTHDNLTLFLVHGPDRIVGTQFLTLEEAMRSKKLKVHETGEVSELQVENRSDQPVFIQSGDIVKGGRQDRVLSRDLVVPPRSGKMSIASFCVEQGRWSQRAGESVGQFSGSQAMLSSKDLKLAARRDHSQQNVWNQVAVAQGKLAAKVGAEVASERSRTSLQLTLESEKVKRSTKEYENALEGVVRNAPDVVGYAFAINGKINSAEVYASRELFLKLWPKLLQAAAVEALSERPETRGPNAPAAAAAPPIGQAEVLTFMDRAEAAKITQDRKEKGVRNVVREQDGHVLLDAWNGKDLLHRTYLKE
jgi:hypothetical protein